jgi:hypothetical protein
MPTGLAYSNAAHAVEVEVDPASTRFCNPDIAHRDPTAWLGM